MLVKTSVAIGLFLISVCGGVLAVENKASAPLAN